MIRVALPILALASPAPAADADWAGAYGGVGVATGGSEAELFVGALTERGPAVLGLELGAGLGKGGSGGLALTGRLGAGLGGTLVYGLAGLGHDGADGAEGDAGVILGAGASRRLGGIRVGGELRHERTGGAGSSETRLGGRFALEF